MESNVIELPEIPSVPNDLKPYVSIRNNKVHIESKLPKEMWQRFKWFRDKANSVIETRLKVINAQKEEELRNKRLEQRQNFKNN